MEYNALRLETMEQLKRADGESGLAYCSRVEAFLHNRGEAARSQWTGRRTWSTHTYPGGCWICDLYAVGTVLLSEMRKYADAEEMDILERQRILREIEELEEAGIPHDSYEEMKSGERPI